MWLMLCGSCSVAHALWLMLCGSCSVVFAVICKGVLENIFAKILLKIFPGSKGFRKDALPLQSLYK